MTCPNGQEWNAERSYCDFADIAKCDLSPPEPQPPMIFPPNMEMFPPQPEHPTVIPQNFNTFAPTGIAFPTWQMDSKN